MYAEPDGRSSPLRSREVFGPGGKQRPQSFATCMHCGTVFGPLNRLTRKYCSDRCAREARRGVPSGKAGRTYPHLRRARIGECAVCGSEFRAVKDFRDRKQKYCSKACWSHRARRQSCEHCGNLFAVSSDRSRFCSRKCAHAEMVGPKASHWRDGKSLDRERARRSTELRLWRQAVLERDGHRCQHCGSIHASLHAHHISPWATDEERRFDVSNGLTLCADCHGKVHGRRLFGSSARQRSASAPASH